MNGISDQRVNFVVHVCHVESIRPNDVRPDDDLPIQPVVVGDSLGASAFLLRNSAGFTGDLHRSVPRNIRRSIMNVVANFNYVSDHTI